jgi:predicted  nucleic acid-binding Zn-ribbon protein
MIELDNPKLYKLIEEKDALVKSGRKISSELETIQFKIDKLVEKEKVITGKHENKDLMTKGEIIRLELERAMKKYDEIAEEIRLDKLAQIPKKIEEEHLALMKKREELEAERNKIALKIQKFKDKIVPTLKKLIKPHLKEFDDTETVEIKDGKILVKTFNYLEDFKTKFKNR